MATLLRDPDAREINCLNLKIWKENPTPDCLVDLPDYQILTHIQDCAGADDHIDNGKASQVLVRDLSSCAFFQILAVASTFSLPHAGHNYTVTTAFAENEECGKLWYTYEPLTKEQYQGWAQGDRYSKGPDAELFPIYLRQGDLLI